MPGEMNLKNENSTTEAKTAAPITDELKAYQELVDQRASDQSSDILPNAGKDHAAIVMSKMFDVTTESARMIVGNFDGAISDNQNYITSLELCIDKNVQFEIIFLDTPNSESKAYNLLLRKKNEQKNISLYKASAEFKASLSKSGTEKHFSVFDKNKYRFEKDTKKFLAWFCFNDSVNALKLSEIFSKGLQTSTPL